MYSNFDKEQINSIEGCLESLIH